MPNGKIDFGTNLESRFELAAQNLNRKSILNLLYDTIEGQGQTKHGFTRPLNLCV